METKARSSSVDKFRNNKVSVASVASQRAVQVELDVVDQRKVMNKLVN